MGIKELEKEYVAGTYGRYDLELVKGKGEFAYDSDGREYIDLSSGIGVNSFGFCDDVWQKAVSEQAKLLQHSSNLFYTAPMARLAEALCKRTGFKKVFFSNSGAEANECAIKAARKYSFDKYGKDRFNIVSLVNSFHGRTMATVTATGQEVFHKYFSPFLPGFKYVPAGDTEALREVIESGDVCAVMIECVQGEGGVLPLREDYVSTIAEICEQNDVLLIADEVQTGNGRTGKLYAYEHFGIKPDIVTTAKGLGGGLPIGATLFSEKTQYVLGKGDHGSTFGGNPVSCAGALSVLERLDEGFLRSVIEKGEYIKKELSSYPGVKKVTGLGLMLGVECSKPASQAAQECIEKGVIVLTAKDKIRLLPPLNISYESLEKALNIIKEVLSE